MAEGDRFQRPIDTLNAQNSFGHNEVGMSHPKQGSYIRLNDAGDLEIVVSDGLAIVMHAKTRSITFVADTVKFLTNDGDSIRWNNNNFNSKATDFTQPSLIPLQVNEMKSLYEGSDYYFEEEDQGD